MVPEVTPVPVTLCPTDGVPEDHDRVVPEIVALVSETDGMSAPYWPSTPQKCCPFWSKIPILVFDSDGVSVPLVPVPVQPAVVGTVKVVPGRHVPPTVDFTAEICDAATV
jgi:hypothetical protein